MRACIKLFAVLALLVLTACFRGQEPKLTPLELQSLQQREFEVPKQTAFTATVSAFQDLGYIIDQASIDTGLITASSPTDNNTQMRATAFIENVGEKDSRIRLNFVTGTIKNLSRVVPAGYTKGPYGSSQIAGWKVEHAGTSKTDTQILNPAFYQAVFEKIETAIFIRS